MFDTLWIYFKFNQNLFTRQPILNLDKKYITLFLETTNLEGEILYIAPQITYINAHWTLTLLSRIDHVMLEVTEALTAENWKNEGLLLHN